MEDVRSHSRLRPVQNMRQKIIKLHMLQLNSKIDNVCVEKSRKEEKRKQEAEWEKRVGEYYT